MKLFIFKVNKLTGEYHPQGHAVVIAKDRARAKALLEKPRPRYDFSDADDLIEAAPTDEEIARGVEYELRGRPKEAVYIHENAGCC